MKILVVSQYFWPETFRVNDLVECLVSRGHEVEVLTGLPNYPSGNVFPGYRGQFFRTQKYQGARVCRVPMLPRFSGKGWQLALNYGSFAFFASLWGVFRCRQNYEAIFVFQPSPITVGLPALLLKWVNKAPVHFWVQDLWPESLVATGAVSSRWALSLVKKMVCLIYRFSDRIYVQAESFVESIETLGVPAKKIQFFPNWAEKFYRPVETKECVELPEGFKIVFAGNIGEAQSFETILDAAETLLDNAQIQWVIFGDGRRMDWVRSEVSRRGLSSCFHIMGRRPAPKMPGYFGGADALLVTLRKSPVFSLTIPSKVQSYLACGRPIIASLDGEGARVVSDSGAGLVCPAGDGKALAEQILKLSNMSETQRSEMGKRGREYFEANFERDGLLDSLEDWMRQTAGGTL